MAPMNSTAVSTAIDLDVIQNRVAVALAKRERLIRSWTASSSRPRPPPKTQKDLDAEDADLFNPTPDRLGLGAPIPKEYLDGDVKRKELWNNDKLRDLIMGKRVGLQATKLRDGREKAKRSLEEECSDEDEGRSALGRAKKFKNGIDQSITIKPFKVEVEAEVRGEVQPKSEPSRNREPDRNSRSDVKPLGKLDIGKEVPPKDSPLQNLKLQATTGHRIPLVDYDSDDEVDRNGKELATTVAQTQQIVAANIPPTVSNSSIKAAVQPNRSAGIGSKSETDTICMSVSPPTMPAVSDGKEPTQLGNRVSSDGTELPTKPTPKSSSSHSSKSRASSTESEPSDLETAIPLALTLDVIERTSLSTADSLNLLSEARRAKNRQKRTRKREKELQRKALAMSIAGGGVERPAVALVGGTGVAKKIKDRLLDANGN